METAKDSKKIKHMSLDKKYKGALPTFSVWIAIKTQDYLKRPRISCNKVPLIIPIFFNEDHIHPPWENWMQF